MLFAHIGCGKDRDEVCGRGGFFYTGAAMGILALYQAHRAYHFETVFSGSLYGLHGGGSCGADVVHDHHARALFAEAFDALAGAVLLLRFTHEEAVHGPASDCHGYDDRVGAHGPVSYTHLTLPTK